MPTVYALKPRFQAALRPFAGWLAAAGITANQVTIAAAAGSLAVGLLVGWFVEQRTMFLLLPLWLLARMALNAVDGMLAREFRQQSRLGAYLNELGDVVSDAALYAPFALVPPFGPFGAGSVIVLAAISEFAGALGPMIGGRGITKGRWARATAPSSSVLWACGSVSAAPCRDGSAG